MAAKKNTKKKAKTAPKTRSKPTIKAKTKAKATAKTKAKATAKTKAAKTKAKATAKRAKPGASAKKQATKGVSRGKRLPTTSESTLVVRTDFSDERAWKALGDAIQAPVGEFQANVELLSDRAYDGVTAKEIVRLASPDDHFFVFLADRLALEGPEHAVLVVDLDEKPGRTFRVIPSEAWSVENNLSLANMEFDEFASAVDEHGVFRGF